MDSALSGIVTVAVAIVGVATLAVLVSPKAQTPAVINSAGNAFTNALGAAVSPVTGGTLGSSGLAAPASVGNFAVL